MKKNDGRTKNETEAREIMRWLNEDEKFSWNKLTELIHDHIKKFDLKYVEELQYERAWETVFAKGGGKNKDGLYWTEFLKIAKAIKGQIVETNISLSEKKKKKNISDISTKKLVRFSLSEFQDTILPIIHKPVLQRKANVIFEKQPNWNQCLNALIEEKIDIAIHSFPTALAFTSNPNRKSDIFFWPFFTFRGYALFVNRKKFKAYCKKKNYSATDFKDFESKYEKEVLKEYLSNAKIVLERYTDVEFVVKEYLTKQGCIWDAIKSTNLLNEKINEGKRKFKDDDYGDILCTNSLHVLDLEGQKDKFELIEKGDKLTMHRNFNGLICTLDFYNENKGLVEEFILTWFKCIRDNIKEWELIKSKYKPNDINNLIYQGLLDHLQTVTYSNKIELDVFIKSYNGNNDFFEEPEFAYEKLFTDLYSTERDIKRNWEIAEIQKQYATSENMNDAFETIKKNMELIKPRIIQ